MYFKVEFLSVYNNQNFFENLTMLKNKFESDLQNKISLIKNVFVNSQENSSLFSTHEYLSFDLIWF